MTSKMSQEAKKDEFRKYLDKAGVLELLTKSLVQLYEVILFIVYSPFSIYGLFISGAWQARRCCQLPQEHRGGDHRGQDHHRAAQDREHWIESQGKDFDIYLVQIICILFKLAELESSQSSLQSRIDALEAKADTSAPSPAAAPEEAKVSPEPEPAPAAEAAEAVNPEPTPAAEATPDPVTEAAPAGEQNV